MLVLYSLLYTLAMLLMSPLFLLRRQKYASGFGERLGNYSEFKQDDRKVIWLHCVSVGETNAARPLVDELIKQFPSHRLVVSTTTRTGQDLAKKIFRKKVDSIFYLPFDWKFSVRRALRNFQPSIVLLMETEIWPRLIVETKKFGSKIAIVNGRLSERSCRRYERIKGFVRAILNDLELALMQGKTDAERIVELGLDSNKAKIAGNLKFEQQFNSNENQLAAELRRRFGIDGKRPLIIAASTHEPEEQELLDTIEMLPSKPRLLIAPRHPERFSDVISLGAGYEFQWSRRSDPVYPRDPDVDIILLDSIGELRDVLELADIVFVGGSLIPHGGQNILEPATKGKAIVVGPYTHNFQSIVETFLENDALIQLKEMEGFEMSKQIREVFTNLINDDKLRQALGQNALQLIGENKGASEKTIELLKPLLKD